MFQQKIEFKNKNIHHNKKITNFCFQTTKTKIYTYFFIVRCANRQRNVRNFLIIQIKKTKLKNLIIHNTNTKHYCDQQLFQQQNKKFIIE